MAFFFALPAIVLEITERGKVKNVPLLTDIKTIFGIKIRHKHEVFFIGLLLHLVLGFFFGLTYIYFVAQGWLLIVGASYSLASFLVFALLSWVVAGLVIYPFIPTFKLFSLLTPQIRFLSFFLFPATCITPAKKISNIK